MIWRKIKKVYKKVIIAVVIIITILLINHLYGVFIQPFIDPYFFKLDNIEKIIGTKLPSSSKGFAMLIEYEIDTEPTYNFAETKGIKEIYASINIDVNTYDSLKEKWDFNDKNYPWNYIKTIENYINVENFEEIKIKYYSMPIYKNDYHGIFKIYRSPAPRTGIFIILTKNQELHMLFVFNIVENHY